MFQNSNCFINDLKFEVQENNWRKMLDTYFDKAFKKIIISNKPAQKIDKSMK